MSKLLEGHQRWEELQAAYDRGDLVTFYERYAAYLEWSEWVDGHSTSPRWELLHAAALATAAELRRLSQLIH